MQGCDLIIKGANLFLGEQGVDVAVAGGRIVDIGRDLRGPSIEAGGRVLMPGFVDSHMHLDKALFPVLPEEKTLLGARLASLGHAAQIPDERVMDDIYDRSARVVEMAIAHGTTCLKTNILITDHWGLRALDVTRQLVRDYGPRIQIQTCVPFQPDYEQALNRRIHEIDFIAGYPTLGDNCREDVDRLFALAERHGLPLDLHVDESDNADISCFEYVIEKTAACGMGGRVTCGHVTALAAPGLDEARAQRAIERAAQAGVFVTTLTSCNLHLMGPHRRGPTRVQQLMEAGVAVSIASDNVRDPFRPFGNANLLEEALLTAQVHKLTTPQQLEEVLRMITCNPAKNSLLEHYGLQVGCYADFVLLDAPSATEALLSQADCLAVFKRGILVEGRWRKSSDWS